MEIMTEQTNDKNLLTVEQKICFKEDDFVKVAHLMKLAATDIENQADYIRAEVNALCDKYKIYN